MSGRIFTAQSALRGLFNAYTIQSECNAPSEKLPLAPYCFLPKISVILKLRAVRPPAAIQSKNLSSGELWRMPLLSVYEKQKRQKERLAPLFLYF
ncbi:MAG: hypothetical protein DBY09_00555 [Selenomonadales bacterium]|nr:MAG: hypothetical protein DBY09_00555 [Selenomonadales bacterium]